MAFATVEARQTGSTTTNAGTHTVTFPAGVSTDELLLAFVASDGGPVLDDSAGRWAKIGGQHRNSTTVTGAVFAKIADGSDTLTVRTRIGDANSVEMISWVTMRISGHGGLPVGVGANGSSTNSNPPALTPPWGAQDYLWIAARMGDAQVPATAAPSGYSTLTGVTHGNTAGACAHTAEKSSNASSEDPGTFTSATEQWAAFTVAVPPSTITTPQLVASYEMTSTTSTTGSLTSPSFTPADGELIIVSASTAGSACVPSVPTASGVTFTSRAQAGTSGSFGQARLSTAEISTSPGSITVTQAFTGSGFVRSFTVERWKNAQLDATPAVAQATGSGGPSTTVTTEAANSIVSYVCTDWNAVAPGAYLYRGTHTTETGLFDVTTTDVTSYYAHQYAPTAGSQTLGLSAPVGQAWSIAGVEIQYEAPAGGGGSDLAAPVIEHSSSYTSSSGNMTADPVTVPFGGTAVAGELLVVTFAGDKNTGTLSVTDNIGSGWTVEASIPGASVSVYIAWKVAVGGETGAVCNMGTSPISGVSGYGAILSQEGTAAWGVCCKAVPSYSDTARNSASSGTSDVATYRGMAFAVCGVDSSSNVATPSWSNGYSSVFSPTTVGDTGGAPALTATAVIERDATTETTLTKTGTTDQMTTTLVVFGRQGLGSAPSFTPRGAFFPFMYG